GTTFRYMPNNQIISGAGPGLYFDKKYKNIYYTLSFLNTPICFYMLDCLNPTVNNSEGDIKRIPFVHGDKFKEEIITKLGENNVANKSRINELSIFDIAFKPVIQSNKDYLSVQMKYLLNEIMILESKILVNESIINELFFEIFDLSSSDRQQVESKMGK